MSRRYWSHERTGDVLMSENERIASQYETTPFLTEVLVLTREQLEEQKRRAVVTELSAAIKAAVPVLFTESNLRGHAVSTGRLMFRASDLAPKAAPA